jgi:hypothetical protein
MHIQNHEMWTQWPRVIRSYQWMTQKNKQMSTHSEITCAHLRPSSVSLEPSLWLSVRKKEAFHNTQWQIKLTCLWVHRQGHTYHPEAYQYGKNSD